MFERLFDPDYILLGDADCNGMVDIYDILLCRDAIFNLNQLGSIGLRNLQLDSSENVDIFSILRIRDVIFES